MREEHLQMTSSSFKRKKKLNQMDKSTGKTTTKEKPVAQKPQFK